MSDNLVRLISYSQPPETEDLRDMTPFDLISYCARVSNPSNQSNTTTSEKLIKYLIKHAHWSPFELVNVCLEIETTRDIAHQMVRHRSFAFQEFSQRYADPTKELAFVTREARLQDTKNRQNSIPITDDDIDYNGNNLSETWEQYQRAIIAACNAAYKYAIGNGIAKEQARVVLPEGLTKTRLYMNGSIRSWIHYIQLRSANGTQKEHADIAIACAQVIAEVFPMINEVTQNA